MSTNSNGQKQEICISDGKGDPEKERKRKKGIKRWVLAQHSVFSVLLKLTSDERHHHKKKKSKKIPLLDHFLPPYEYYEYLPVTAPVSREGGVEYLV